MLPFRGFPADHSALGKRKAVLKLESWRILEWNEGNAMKPWADSLGGWNNWLSKTALIGVVILVGMAPALSVLAKKPPPEAYVEAKVDERVEMMCIIARLAGYEEYRNDEFKLYAEDVDKYFERHAQHPAVQFMVKMRDRIGFDALMSMAVCLNPPPALSQRVAFSDQIPEVRWGKQSAGQFVPLIQRFYKDAACRAFFKSHEDLYRTVELRFQNVLQKVDYDWYKGFFGRMEPCSFYLYIGLLNGGNGYGPEVLLPNGRRCVYSICGAWEIDDQGLPVWKDRTVQLIVHEYNHSFINDLVKANETRLRTSGEKIHTTVEEEMHEQHYGTWQATISESLVRAAELRYEFRHGASGDKVYYGLIRERNKGFLWIDELFSLLGVYENSGGAYPTFQSFFPMIVSYYGDLAERIDDKTRRFRLRMPQVVAIQPFDNNARDVDPNIKQLTLTFDKPLDRGGYSINRRPGEAEQYPVKKVIGFNDAGTSFSIQIELKPDSEYEFSLTGLAFTTKDDYYPLQTYTVKFKTKK